MIHAPLTLMLVRVVAVVTVAALCELRDATSGAMLPAVATDQAGARFNDAPAINAPVNDAPTAAAQSVTLWTAVAAPPPCAVAGSGRRQFLHRAQRDWPSPLYAQLDRDHNGRIDPVEATGMPNLARAFAACDADASGDIDPSEAIVFERSLRDAMIEGAQGTREGWRRPL